MVSLLHCSLVLSFFICIIISFRPAWLARVLLCYKRTQSSGNDDVDEGQKTPFGALMIIYARVAHLSFRRLLIQQQASDCQWYSLRRQA